VSLPLLTSTPPGQLPQALRVLGGNNVGEALPPAGPCLFSLYSCAVHPQCGMTEGGGCGVCECKEEDIPAPWRQGDKVDATVAHDFVGAKDDAKVCALWSLFSPLAKLSPHRVGQLGESAVLSAVLVLA
jgi:hypothetical protein